MAFAYLFSIVFFNKLRILAEPFVVHFVIIFQPCFPSLGRTHR